MMLFRSFALLAAVAGCANAFVTPTASISRDVSLNVETVRKKEFVASMAEELGCTKTDAEASLALVLEMISDVSWDMLVLFFDLRSLLWREDWKYILMVIASELLLVGHSNL